jgi:hypothetical protein
MLMIFYSFTLLRLELRNAWLILWDKHMTTGRINQGSQITEFGSRDR